jgi:hypothetical protein
MHLTNQEVPLSVAAKAREKRSYSNCFISLQGLESLCHGDETLQECLNDTICYSLRYAETVCRFEQIVKSGQESNENGMREEIERVRSNTHTATINSINALSRVMKTRNKDNSWISKVSASDRASYGKFAILLAFEAALTLNPQII